MWFGSATNIGKLSSADQRLKVGPNNVSPSTVVRDLETWSKVREVTHGRSNYRDIASESTLTADSLNRYYADISTDQAYISAKRKHTAVGVDDYFTEYDVFHMLDRQKPTATGIDGLPVWFLRVSASIIAAPLAALFNHSVSAGVVPRQWKNAIITPGS